MKPATLFLLPLFFIGAALSLSAHPAAAEHKAQTLPAPAGNSVAGVKIGMDKDDAHAALIAQGATDSAKNAAQDKDADAKKSKGADPDDALPELWMLKGTPYEKVAFASDPDDKIRWVTGFARPGQGIPFAQLGSLTRAAASGPAFAVWNVISPTGSYRVLARGHDGKAMTVTLLPLKSVNPNGAFSPQIIPKNLSAPKTGTTSPKAGAASPK